MTHERINCRVVVRVRYSDQAVQRPFSNLDEAWAHYDRRATEGNPVELVDTITGDVLRRRS